MKNYKVITASMILLVVAILVTFTHNTKDVQANSSFALPTCQTTTATTSVSYMTPGTATTTLTCDSQQNGVPRLIDKGMLGIQLAASSTATKLIINTEYSVDGIDWYQDGGNINYGFASTSKPFDIGQVNQINFSFASSTAGLGAVSLNLATTTRAFFVNAPTRYTRFIFSLPIGSTNGAVWAQFAPQRQAIQ